MPVQVNEPQEIFLQSTKEEGSLENIITDSPILIGQTGPLNGERWIIRNDLNLGRDETCDILIPDRQVSRFHARIMVKAEGILLEDLASKNGTYVNGERIEASVILQDGDTLRIAMIQDFVYLSSDATMPLGPGIAPVVKIHEAEQRLVTRLYLDKLSRRVWIDDREVVPPLSVPQFRLLEALYDNHGKVVSRQELIVSVWGDKEAIGVSEQALDALIRRLRDRLAELEPNHSFLVTIRGYGLRLDDPLPS